MLRRARRARLVRGDVVRIVSLVPSVTETLSSWERTPVACTRFCERPDLLHVGGTKDPDVQRIVELRPDLVVLDAEENRREDHDDLVARDVAVFVLHVRALDDVNRSMAALAAHVGATWSTLVLDNPRPRRLRAMVPIWRRPWMALGSTTYGSSLLTYLGVENAVSLDRPYPEMTYDEMVAIRPDVVLAPSEPYPFTTRQLAELEAIAPTFFVDGKDLFWWGSRSEGALARLAEQLSRIA